MKKYLLASIIAESNSEIAYSLTQLISQAGCEIMHLRMSQPPANKTVVYCYLSGSWDAIAKLEASLTSAQKKLKFDLILQHLVLTEPVIPYLPYNIQVFAFQSTDTVYFISKYLLEQGAKIFEVNVDTLRSTDKEFNLHTLSMDIGIPLLSNMSTIREGLMILSDDLNIDMVMEPLRNL